VCSDGYGCGRTAVDAVRGGSGVCMHAQREGGEVQVQPQRAYMHRRVYVHACGHVHVPVGASGVGAGTVRWVQYTAGGRVLAYQMRVGWLRWVHSGCAMNGGCIPGGQMWHDIRVGGRCGECQRMWRARAQWVTDTDAADTGVCAGGGERLRSGGVHPKESAASRTGHRLSQKAVGTGISGAAGVCGGEWRRSQSEAAGSHQGLGTPRSSSTGAASAHWRYAHRAGGGRGRKSASHV
jgi:hypothetical protein